MNNSNYLDGAHGWDALLKRKEFLGHLTKERQDRFEEIFQSFRVLEVLKQLDGGVNHGNAS